MQKEKLSGLTLAEALASGRPFKHRDWKKGDWVILGTEEAFFTSAREANSCEWQIQPEDLHSLKVWRHGVTYELICQRGELEREDKHAWYDYTNKLAAALLPHLKELLK